VKTEIPNKFRRFYVGKVLSRRSGIPAFAGMTVERNSLTENCELKIASQGLVTLWVKN
jgi:hypothetical protein